MVNRYRRWLLAGLLWLLAGCETYYGSNPTDLVGSPVDERTGTPAEAVDSNDPGYRATWQQPPRPPSLRGPVIQPPE